MLRTPEALIPYLLATACLVGGGIWHAADQVRPGQVVTSGRAEVGGPFALLDQNGETKTDADFHGRWMFIYFGYTNCPDVCPTTLALMSEVTKRLGSKSRRIAPIFITVDPARDSSRTLKLYLGAFGPQIVGLTGPKSHIASVESEYHVYVRNRPLPGGQYAVDHSNVIYLMDPNGKFAANYDNSQGPDEIAADLEKRL